MEIAGKGAQAAEPAGDPGYHAFGLAPNDWKDSALWLLAWSKPWPSFTAAERTGVVKALAEHLSPAEESTWWATDDTWCALETREHDAGGDFSRRRALFDALHGVVPLREVLHASATDVPNDELARYRAAGIAPCFSRGLDCEGVGVMGRLDPWLDDIEQAYGQADPMPAHVDAALEAERKALHETTSGAAAQAALASGELAFVPVQPPQPLALTPEEAAALEGCDERFIVRTVTGSLAAHHRDENAPPPPEYAHVLKKVTATALLLLDAGERYRWPLEAKHQVERLLPSPSGRRVLVKDKRKLEGQGHAVEYGVGQAPAVAVTCTEGSGYAAPTLWDVVYVQDDDTMVAAVGSGKEACLLLLERDPASGRFEEVHNVRDGATRLAACGAVVAADGDKKITLYGVIAHQLVKLAAIDRPAPYGIMTGHPSAAPTELHFAAGETHHRLVNFEALLQGKEAKRPPKNSAIAPRVVDRRPQHATPERMKELFRGCWSDARDYQKAVAIFCSAKGRVAAARSGELLIAEPDGTVHRDPAPLVMVRTVHPTDERALGFTKERALHEVDLETRQSVEKATQVAIAAYLLVDGQELLAIQEQGGPELRVYAHRPGQPGLGALVGTYPIEGGSVAACGHAGFLHSGLGKKGDAMHHVRVALADGAATFSLGPQVVLPGARYAGAMVFGATYEGRGYLSTTVSSQPYVFRLPAAPA